ncbi:hypothetical protein BC830DRAFT_1135620, partial [Chytriomyces sp. MP71]
MRHPWCCRSRRGSEVEWRHILLQLHIHVAKERGAHRARDHTRSPHPAHIALTPRPPGRSSGGATWRGEKVGLQRHAVASLEDGRSRVECIESLVVGVETCVDVHKVCERSGGAHGATCGPAEHIHAGASEEGVGEVELIIESGGSKGLNGGFGAFGVVRRGNCGGGRGGHFMELKLLLLLLQLLWSLKHEGRH